MGRFDQVDELKYVRFGRDVALCGGDHGLRTLGADVGGDSVEFARCGCSEDDVAGAGFCEGIRGRFAEATATTCDQDTARVWEGDL